MKKFILLSLSLFFITSLSLAQEVGLNVGDKAPELAFKSPDGKVLKLSDLKGKMVLIDFWASWCGPCRRENPNVVNAYNKYKSAKFKNKAGKGLEVYSVSLDSNKDRWLAAIKKDKLDWEWHVSDLGGWKSEGARIYGVRSIPTNVLINGDGIIVAKNLRGPNLHYKLDDMVKSL